MWLQPFCGYYANDEPSYEPMCAKIYVQFFGDRITEPLFSGSLFAIHRNKHWHNVCFIYTFISLGQRRVSKSRNKKLRRGDKNTQEQKFWSIRHNDQCWCHTYTAINHKTLWQWHYLHFLTEISYSRVKPWLHSQLLDTFHPLKVNIFAVKSYFLSHPEHIVTKQ